LYRDALCELLLHPTENRDLAIQQVFANSSVDRKIVKLGGYRKISAKYTVFTTIFGVALLSFYITTKIISPIGMPLTTLTLTRP